MKTQLDSFPTASRLLCALTVIPLVTLVWLSPAVARAGTDTWTGGGASDNWSDVNNWGGTAPVANDQLTFDGTSRMTPNNDFPAGTIFNSVSIAGTAGAFVIGGNGIVLTNAGDAGGGLAGGGSISNACFNAEAINLPVTFSIGKHVLDNEGGSQLTLGGPLTRKVGATVLFAPLAGTINLTGSGLANVNGILGGWAILGNDWASLDGSGNAVPYAAYTPISSGAIASAAGSNLKYSGDSANLTAANGTTINSLVAEQGTSGRSLTVTGVLRLGANGGVYRDGAATGTFTVTGGNLTTSGSGGELNFSDAPFTATANNLTIASVITNDTGAASVSVNILGYVVLSGANTFSGGTFINQGRVQASSTSSFGTGPVFVNAGAEAFLNNNGTFANSFTLAGIGATETSGGQQLGAIRMNTGATTVSGTVTLAANTRISGGSGGNNTFSGKITGPGRLELTAATGNNGSIILSNPNNDWSGGLLVTVASSRQVYLKLGANNTIPNGPGKGDLTLNSTSAGNPARFDLNGFSATINGLVSSADADDQVADFGTAPSTLTLGNNDATAEFGGIIEDGTAPNVLSIVKIGAGTQTLSGACTYKGGTTVSGGSLVFSSTASLPNTASLTVNSNAILDISALIPSSLVGSNTSLAFSNGTLVLPARTSTATLTAFNLYALGLTNYITLSAIGPVATYPAQFPIIKATNVIGTLNFGLAGPFPVSPGAPFAGYITNNVANNSVDLCLTSGPLQIKWVGYSSGTPNSAWDSTTPNWELLSGASTSYSDGDFVLFDDSASNNLVTLNQTVAPAGITLSNAALTYTLNDNGGGSRITGSGRLTKQGAGTFILDDSGINDFTGPITISGGTLQVGSNDFNGTLPATAILDNGTLAFARLDPILFPNVISGTGGIAMFNSVGNSNTFLSLSGLNTFSGAVNVSQGTLQTANNSALGTTNGGTTIDPGATLDVNNSSLGAEPVTVSGTGVGNNGAIVNSTSATAALAALNRITLAGDTWFGGSGRWDLRLTTSGLTDPAACSLSTSGSAFSLTKVGANFIAIANVTVDPKLANINILSGTLSFESNTTGLGDPAGICTVGPGATLELWNATNQFNKQFVLNGDGIANTLLNGSGANTVNGPIALTGNVLFTVNGTALTVNGLLNGPGTLNKLGNLPLTLNGDGSGLTNGVTDSAGTLTLNGVLGGPLTNAAFGTLAGTGTNSGLVDISGILVPGGSNAIGTLTTGPLILESGGTVSFDLNYNPAPGGGTNDLVVVNGDLTVNGNQILINPLDLLQKGVPYRLFTYTGHLIWNSDLSVVGVNNYTFTLDTNTPGQINLIASGGPPAWTGGSAADSYWSDAANWGGTAIMPGSLLYFDGNIRPNNTNDTAAGTSYGNITFTPNAGAFTLNGNPITLGGNIVNNSTNAQTIDLGIILNASGYTLDGATSPLIVGGGLTNTANIFTTSLLAGDGILTNLLASTDPAGTNTLQMTDTNGNWTVMDNPGSIPISVPWAIDIRAGAFTFGVGANAPNLYTTTVNGQPQDNQVGITGGATGTFNMSNGTFTTTARLNTATVLNSTGILNVYGGTMNIGNQFQGANGSNLGEVSVVNLVGGTMNIGSATNPASQFYNASRGTGTLNISNNAVLNCGNLDVARNAAGNTFGSIGVINLDGGTITCTRVGTATANSQSGPPSSGITPSATFNFNGGVLRARASSATFFQGNAASPAIPIATIVRAGGAFIDSDTNSISILEPMQHDSTLGATADGGLTKLGSGTVTLTAASTFTGPTLVSNGTLVVNGSLSASAVTVTNGATLAGTGTCGNGVIVQPNGTVAPGNLGVIGALTVTGTATLNGNTVMDINAATATNDVLKAGSIAYAGTLTVSNLSGGLRNGATFKLFSAGTLGGAFTSYQLPALWPGLSWVTSALGTSGSISVSGTIIPPQIISSVVSGNTVTLSGSGGVAGGTYYVLEATNVTQPLATWTRIATNTFDAGGNFSWVGTPNVPPLPAAFFRILGQ